MSSKKELCSEYGTPNNCMFIVEAFMGLMFAHVKDFAWDFAMTDGIEGWVSLPLACVKLRNSINRSV